MLICHVGGDGITATHVASILSSDDYVVIYAGDTSDGIDHGTMDNSDTSWTLSDLVNRIPYDIRDCEYEFDWMHDINALQATEMMVRIARAFVCPPLLNHHRKPFRANRMMFSKSGYLPKRIRRIRK